MIKEYIKVLDNLRSEEVRFDFDPLNKNLCFCAPGGGGGGNPLANARDNLLSGLGVNNSSSSSSGDTSTSGGLSEEDKAMKQMFYDEIKELFDTEYTPYTGDPTYKGDVYANRDQGEMDLLTKLKEGGGYGALSDTARTNLGFTSDAFKKGAEYGVGDLDRDAGKLMGAGSTYRDQVADTTMRQMGEFASQQGMINRGHQIGGGAAWGDRSFLQDSTNNQNFASATGDVLGKMNMSAYNNALDRASGLNTNRLNAAGRYGDTVMQDLGIGIGGLDKTYSSGLGAYGQDRSYQDRDLAWNKQKFSDKFDWDKKQWDEKQNYPFKKLAYASGLYSGMPFEEKVVNQQPASSGK